MHLSRGSRNLQPIQCTTTITFDPFCLTFNVHPCVFTSFVTSGLSHYLLQSSHANPCHRHTQCSHSSLYTIHLHLLIAHVIFVALRIYLSLVVMSLFLFQLDYVV